MVLAPDYSTFYAKFKYDNQANKNTLIFLCIQSGIITDISSSVINYFNIDLPSVKKGKVNINDYIPGVLAENSKYMDPKGSLLLHKYVYRDVEVQIPFNCQVSQVKFTNSQKDADEQDGDQSDFELIGYEIRLDKIEKAETMATNLMSQKVPTAVAGESKILKVEISKYSFDIKEKLMMQDSMQKYNTLLDTGIDQFTRI